MTARERELLLLIGSHLQEIAQLVVDSPFTPQKAKTKSRALLEQLAPVLRDVKADALKQSA